MGSRKFVRVEAVRIVRTASYGVFCIVHGSDRETFVPFAQVYEPPPSRLLPGSVLPLKVPEWFARDHRLA
jgi:hypothetical protein